MIELAHRKKFSCLRKFPLKLDNSVVSSGTSKAWGKLPVIITEEAASPQPFK